MMTAIFAVLSPFAASQPAAQAATWPQIALSAPITGFSQPADIVNAGDGSKRLFVNELGGLIRIIDGGAVLPTPFLDLSGLVTCDGLLSLAFSPNYEANGEFYVAHMIGGCDLVIARYTVGPDPNVADPASREQVLHIPVATPTDFAHSGGQILFGPDGYLYVSVGDGRLAEPPEVNGQDPSTLLGKVLRLDVETGNPPSYTIPSSNPFLGTPGFRPEIWAMGFRNPYRMAFDSQTGDLFVGDVGQFSFEEMNHQPGNSPGGQNYGWPIMEASSCYGGAACDTTGLTLPVSQFTHSDGCVMTTGEMSRAPQAPGLYGFFFYGDWCTGKIWGLTRSTMWESQLLLDTDLSVVGFGQDEDGNIWVADYAGGGVHRLIQDCGVNPCDFDGDRLPDATDNCPSAPGPSGNNGCPLVQGSPGGTPGAQQSSESGNGFTCVPSPAQISSANHRLVRVNVDTNLQRGSAATLTLERISSNQPASGLGKHDRPRDIKGWKTGTLDETGRLRAEGAGKRIYTIEYSITGGRGKAETCTAKVPVTRGEG
jgi:glucose/arabinose dehydrogenase